MLRTGRRGGLALAAALAVAAIAVSTQGHVLLHRCVAAGGSWTDLAVRFAVLRSDTACPDGTLGVGTVPSGAVVLLSVALPALAAWALVTALGISLTAVVVRAAHAVVALALRWVRLPRPAAALPVPDRAPSAVAGPPPPLPAASLLVARPHRAPPLPA